MCKDFKFEVSGKVLKQTTILTHQGYTEEDIEVRGKNWKIGLWRERERGEERDTSGEVDEGVAIGRHTVRLWQAAELLPPGQDLMILVKNMFKNKLASLEATLVRNYDSLTRWRG